MKKGSPIDDRIFKLMEWSVKNDLVQSEGEFWEKIGFTRTNVRNVKNGLQGFRREHIKQACILTGADANWILGIESNMFREKTENDPLKALRKATASIEELLQIYQSNNGVNKNVKSARKITRK
jgi:hypothetical protein